MHSEEEREPSFDWPAFFSLFWNDKGIRLRLNIPDTVLFRYGQLSAWWTTSPDGFVHRQTAQGTTFEAIRRKFLQVAEGEERNYSKFAAVTRNDDGKPQLLCVQAFNQLCETLSDRLECGVRDKGGDAAAETPSVLQAYITPQYDVRYITALTTTSEGGMSCHSFQRKFSRRYAAAAGGGRGAVVGFDRDDALLLSPSSASGSAATDGPGDKLRRAEAEADRLMGAVDATLKAQLKKITVNLVGYIQKAHGLSLGGIVCEYIRDPAGKIYLLAVLKTEWASSPASSSPSPLGQAAAAATAATEEENGNPTGETTAPVAQLLGLVVGEGQGNGEVVPSSPAQPPLGYSKAEGEGDKAGGKVDPPLPLEVLPEEGEEDEEESLGIKEDEEGSEDEEARDNFTQQPAPYLHNYRSPVEGSHDMEVVGGHTTSLESPPPPATAIVTATILPPAPPVAYLSDAYAESNGSQGGSQGVDYTPPTTAGAASSSPSGQSLRHVPHLNPYGAGSLPPWLAPPAPPPPKVAPPPPPPPSHTAFLRSSGAAPLVPTSASSSSSMGGGTAPLLLSTPPPPTSSAAAVHRPATAPMNAAASSSAVPSGGSALSAARALSASQRGGGGGGPAFGSSAPRTNRPMTAASHSSQYYRHQPSSPSSPASASSRQPLSPDLAARSALGGPVSYLSAHGIHTNGQSVAPSLVQRLSTEVEVLRGKLRLQEEELQARQIKIQMLEKAVEQGTGTATAWAHDLSRQVTTLCSDLAVSRAETETWRVKAEASELRRLDLEQERSGLRRGFEGEVSAALQALRESQRREEEVRSRATQMEAEVERLADLLKVDRAAIEALKRQLGPYQGYLADTGVMDPGLAEVAERTSHLLQLQGNPEGEKYALQKILATHSADLRAVFLHYVQLEVPGGGGGGGVMKRIWPPAMSYAQWQLFCKETQTAESRSLVLPSSKSSVTLSVADCEAIFVRYSKEAAPSPAAMLGGITGGGGEGLLTSSQPPPARKPGQQQQSPHHHHRGQILSYELWLSALVHCASRLRPSTKTFPFLSEALREYLLKHIIMGAEAYQAGGGGGGPFASSSSSSSSPHRPQRGGGGGGGHGGSPMMTMSRPSPGSPTVAPAKARASSAAPSSSSSSRKKSGVTSKKKAKEVPVPPSHAPPQSAWAEPAEASGEEGPEEYGGERPPRIAGEAVIAQAPSFSFAPS